MSQSFDNDDQSLDHYNSLPQVNRPKTSRSRRMSLLSRQEGMGGSPYTEHGLSSPEDISMEISPFRERIPKKRNNFCGNEKTDEKLNGYLSERNLQVESNYRGSHTPKLKYDKAFSNENRTQENTEMYHGKSQKSREQNSSFMHLLLAESTTPEPCNSQDVLCDSGSRHEIALRKRQAVSQDFEGRVFSPKHTFPNRNIVPRLNIPPDIGIDRENTLIGLSRTPGCQATPSTPEDMNRSICYSDRKRDTFGRKPKEVTDPLDDLMANQQISERKYPILPSIGTPIMMRRSKGQNSHRNQLDYTRDRYELDAGFFSDYSGKRNPPEVISSLNPVPLPPIQHSSTNRNIKNSEPSTESSSSRDDGTSSPKIPFSERLVTETMNSFSK